VQLRILGRTRAPEKVGSFLLDMAARCACGPIDNLLLPMSRYDIADYLALSGETVSRAMTDLQQRGAITLAETRRVTIVDHSAFQEADNDDVPLSMRTIAAASGAGRGTKSGSSGMEGRASDLLGQPTDDPIVDITARIASLLRGESHPRDDGFAVAPTCERGGPRPSAH
jgi:hypothetical protein